MRLMCTLVGISMAFIVSLTPRDTGSSVDMHNCFQCGYNEDKLHYHKYFSMAYIDLLIPVHHRQVTIIWMHTELEN